MTNVAEPDHQPQPPTANAADHQDVLNLLQRERADFLNYRRRAMEERNQERDRVRLETLTALLPLLDDLDLAVTQVPPDLAQHPWTQGLLLSHRRLLEFIARSGLEPFGAVGELFDPALHEAVFYEQRPEYVVRRVETVIRPGYRMGGRIVRPALVGVVGPVEEEPTDAIGTVGETNGAAETVAVTENDSGNSATNDRR